MEHIYGAYGIVVEGEAGWKLAFSGDTRPARSVSARVGGAPVIETPTGQGGRQSSPPCLPSVCPS